MVQARLQELSVVALDVGPAMAPHLQHAIRGVLSFLHSKIIGKPHHEVAVVAFGTTETHNEPNEESEAQGVPDQYVHITTLVPLGLPSIDTMKAVRGIEPGAGVSDFVDALVVGIDMLNKRVAADGGLQRVPKRVIVISNFLSLAKEDVEGQFMESLAASFTQLPATLEVMSLDIAEEDAAGGNSGVKSANMQQLDALFGYVDHVERSFTTPQDLAVPFPAKEHSPTYTIAKLPLEIGSAKIALKLSNKTTREKFPLLGKESPLHAPGSFAGVEESKFRYREGDPEKKPVDDPEAILRSYRYGVQNVPMTSETIEMAKFAGVSRGLKLIGFMAAGQTPRTSYLGVAVVGVADKDDPRADVALAALVTTLLQRQQVALLRVVMREASTAKVQIMVAEPVIATGIAPPHLLMNYLPFQEDIRAFSFPSFEKQERRPTQEQAAAMEELVEAMSLERNPGSGGRRDWSKIMDAMPNPALHRMMDAATDKALESVGAAPGLDWEELMRHFTSPPMDERVEAAVAAVAAALPTGKAAKAAKAVHRLRSGHEEEDFVAMMDQENFSAAISAMRRNIDQLVDQSVGESKFGTAVDRLELLRRQCVVHPSMTYTFNTQMRQLQAKYARLQLKAGFWGAVCARGVTLIAEHDVPLGVIGVASPEDADNMLKEALPAEAAAVAEGAGEAKEEREGAEVKPQLEFGEGPAAMPLEVETQPADGGEGQMEVDDVAMKSE